VRGWLGRRCAASRRLERQAAIQIQSRVKGHQSRQRVRHLREEKHVKRLMVRRDRAALRIQSWSRGTQGRYNTSMHVYMSIIFFLIMIIMWSPRRISPMVSFEMKTAR
jgi:hypothetical protein